MNLLEAPWVPVRSDHGAGPFRLLTLEELLCSEGTWRVSLPRDDLELAGLQLLVCMAQVMFIPKDDAELRRRCRAPLTPEELHDGFSPCADWFDLDHPTQPFMQTRDVVGKRTSVQKLLPGMPESTSTSPSAHSFFNTPLDVEMIGGTVAAIALFNQAANAPSFGGGFKAGLRGAAPITTLVGGNGLRETIWRNVVTLPRVQDFLPNYAHDHATDRPTWIQPIVLKQRILGHEIGLTRGLFWQPAHIELERAGAHGECDVLARGSPSIYSGFRTARFLFDVDGLWPHLHGVRLAVRRGGKIEDKFASFRTSAPAWTHLTQFVIASPVSATEPVGSVPAAPVQQAPAVFPAESLHLIVGGYWANKASIEERRHEIYSLAEVWDDDGRGRLTALVRSGVKARDALLDALFLVGFGCELERAGKKIPIKGVGLTHKKKGRKLIRRRDDAYGFHDSGERLFYAHTESLFHETLREGLSRQAWRSGKAAFIDRIAATCRDIYGLLTDPYTHKAEFIPIVAWARRSLYINLKMLKEES